MATLQFPLYQQDLCADLKKTFLKRASDTDSTRSGESVIDEVTQNLSTDIAVYAEKLIKSYTSEGGSVLAGNVDFEGAEDGAVLTYDGAAKKWVGKLGSGYVTRQEWEDFVSGTDADNVINKWSEVEKFLMGMKETDNLNNLLKDKMSVKMFLKLFTPIDKDGNELDFSDEKAEVASIRANYGLWSVDFVSALGKSTGGEAGGGGGDTPAGSSGALYDLVDVLANESGDGVKGAVTGSVLIFNGTHWEAGDPPTNKDTYTKEEIDKLIESVKFFERVNIGTETSPRYAIHVLNSLGFYSDDFISALGKSYGGGGSSEAGDFYDRLDAWEDYDDSTKEWVLSAFLGYDLYTRIGELDKRLTVVEKKDTYTKEEIDAMILFEKKNIGTEAEPIYAIHAKYGYGVYSDDFISALGVSPDGMGSGGTSYDRLDDWGDYTDDKAEWVLSALLGENLNERLLAIELGNKGHLIDIVGGGNVVTDVYENSSKTSLTFVKGNVSWTTIVEKPTTLEGFGITDGVNDFEVTGTGNAFTDVSIMGHIISLNKGETFLPKSAFDELFEKVNIGTSSAPEYAIRAKYGFYSDSFVSAKGYGDSSGGSDYRLDSWDDYTSTRGGWVLSAYLGNDLNERVTALEDGTAGKAGHIINVTGSGGVVTNVEELGNTLTFYKGVVEWATGITGFPKNLTNFGINNVGRTSLPIYMKSGVPTEVVASELFSSLVAEGDKISMTIAGQTRNVVAGYATSAGNASTATALTSSAGSAILPIYFSDGKPVACTASSVFSDLSNSGNNLSLTVAGQNRTLTVAYATNADTVDGEHSSAFAHIGAHNNLIASGNEFTFASSGFNGDVYINYRTAGGPNGNITNYIFGNGAGGSLGTAIHSGNYNSYSPTLTGTGASGTWNISVSGNAATATKFQTARTLWGQSFNGSANVSGDMSGVGQITFSALSGTNGRILLYQQMADNDYFRIYVGATASDAGYVEIATADGGNEPIYVRQYTGVFGTVVRTLTLLDGSGNTTFPGLLTAPNGTINGTLKVGAIPLTNSSSGVLKIDGNLIVTGGITMYSTDGTASSSLPYLPLTGGTLTGNLAISGANKVYFNGLSSWIYADDNGYLHLYPSEGLIIENDTSFENWEVSMGGLSVVSTITASSIRNRNYDDNYVLLAGGGVKKLSEFGSSGSYLPLTGGSLSGSLSVSGSVTASSGFVKSGYNDNYVLLAGGGTKAVSDFSSGSSSYLPLTGGTLTGTLTMSNAMIVTPGNDSYGIRPALNNYGTVGTSSYYYYKTYSTYYYGSYISLSGGSVNTGGGSIATNGGNITTSGGYVSVGSGYFSLTTGMIMNGSRDSAGMMKFSLAEGCWFDNDVYFETGFSDLSDIRKKDIFAEELLSLEEIASAPIIRFAYRSDAKKRTHIGTSAQYWLCEGDWFVNETPDGYYTLESANLALAVGLSLGQHLLEFKTTIEKRIEALEKENTELKKRIAALEVA